MNQIQLSREIDARIREANLKVEDIIKELKAIDYEGKALELTYRVKDKQEIVNQMQYLKAFPKYRNEGDLEILNRVPDMISVSMIVKDEKDIKEMVEKINKRLLENKELSIVKEGEKSEYRGSLGEYSSTKLRLKNLSDIAIEIELLDEKNRQTKKSKSLPTNAKTLGSAYTSFLARLQINAWHNGDAKLAELKKRIKRIEERRHFDTLSENKNTAVYHQVLKIIQGTYEYGRREKMEKEGTEAAIHMITQLIGKDKGNEKTKEEKNWEMNKE